MYNGIPPYEKRYRFTLTLTVITPLHVGGGEPETKASEGTPIRFARDNDNRPYIPGSTIKGIFHANFQSAFGTCAENLLGEEQVGQPIVGGKLHFHDAPIAAGNFENVTHVTLDPVTRTAREKFLYTVEQALPGTTFTVTVFAPRLSENEFTAFAGVMQSATHSFRFGAGQHAAYGEATLSGFQAECWDLKTWLAGGPNAPTFQPVALPVMAECIVPTRNLISVPVTIFFDGPVLVRGNAAQDRPQNELVPVARNGRIYLPGSSIRGALRAQAARIWRTVGHNSEVVPSLPDGRRASVPDPRELHPFEKLFGVAGWRSPLEIPDFHLVDNGAEYEQSFVSIDRFTGGAEPARLFSASTRYKPVFQGTIQIDITRLQCAEVGTWAIALAMFLERDLREGDVLIGSGAARGFGSCKWSITLPPELQATFALEGFLDQDCALASNLIEWVEQFEKIAQEA